MRFASSWCRVKDQEIMVHLLINLHDTCFVSTPVAVVRCREDSDNRFVMTPIVPVHHQLMRPRNEFKIICVIEVLRDVLAKCEACTSRRNTPAMSVIWVRPQEIAHWSFVGHFNLSINLSNLIERIQVGRETSMKSEYLIFNDCG